jgi:N-acetylglucosamine-6-phosphate deacetylase
MTTEKKTAAGLIDLQVNGHAGVDFNGDDWHDEALLRCCRDLRESGVAGILATVITAPTEVMCRRIERIAAAIETYAEVAAIIRGVHIEGPFLNPADGYIGAHPAAAAGPVDWQLAAALREAAGEHLKLWTLAPEMDPHSQFTRRLSDQGITVAAGHCDASLDQLREAIDAGLAMYTHLGNGCPAQLPRHDNIIQRVLALGDQLTVSFIADGHHVPWFALRNYLRALPDERIVIVSDAMAAAGLGPGRYRLADQWVEVDPDLSAWAEGRGHYAGSATSLPQMHERLQQALGISPARLDRWMIDNPRRLCGL